MKFRVLASLLTPRVICLSPWARQTFPALIFVEPACGERDIAVTCQFGVCAYVVRASVRKCPDIKFSYVRISK